MKKIIALVLAFVVLLGAFPVNALAGQYVQGPYIEEGDQNPDNYRLDDEMADGLKAGYRYVKRYNDQYLLPEEYMTIKSNTSEYAEGYIGACTSKFKDDFIKKAGLDEKGLSEYERIAKIYLYVVWADKHFQDGIAGYFENIGVCQDVTGLFVDLCGMFGIDAIGVANIGHQWAMVKLEGKWYFCDCQGGKAFLIGWNDVLLSKKVKDQVHYACVSQASFDTKDDEVEWRKWEKYSGHIYIDKFFEVFPEIKKNLSETRYSRIPKFKNTLPKVNTTKRETPEGTIIEWEPVNGADFYIVYTYKTWIKDFDGIPYCIKNGHTNLMPGVNNHYVHRVAMNENGKYQYNPYVDGNNEEMRESEFARFYYVVAYNCNSETSESIPIVESDAENIMQSKIDGGFNAYWFRCGTDEYLYENYWCTGQAVGKGSDFVDKYNGETPPSTAIYRSKFNEKYLLKPSNQFTKKHSFKKVRTLIVPTATNKGAVLYECENCLQRKVVYPFASADKQNSCSHNKTETVTVQPSCTAAGKKQTVCADCYKVISAVTIPKLGHAGFKQIRERKAGLDNYCEYCKTGVCKRCEKEIELSRKPEVKTVKLSKYKLVYNGKKQAPTLIVKDKAGNALVKGRDYTVTGLKKHKKVGYYNVTVKGKGCYEGTVELCFGIIPKTAEFKKPVIGKTSVTVKWKKQKKQVSGYQIQYSVDDNFDFKNTINIKGADNTSKTLKGFYSDETVFVRIRTYKTVNGTKFYSKWSKIMSVKTK